MGFIEIFIILLSLFLIWIIPRIQIAREIQEITPVERVGLENELRKTLTQAFGGIVIIIGLFFTGQELSLSREAQISERFTTAINQIGSSSLEIRLGGIYALESIAKHSPEIALPTVDVFTAFIREHAPIEEDLGRIKDKKDVEAAMNVVCCRGIDIAEFAIDLRGVDLRRKTFLHPHLNKANFNHSILSEASFINAELEDAQFMEASLIRTKLVAANLENANLFNALMKEVNLSNANLRAADLRGGVLVRANLNGADLRGADLREANLSGANLIGTKLQGANLKYAIISEDQIETALTDERTIFN